MLKLNLLFALSGWLSVLLEVKGTEYTQMDQIQEVYGTLLAEKKSRGP